MKESSTSGEAGTKKIKGKLKKKPTELKPLKKPFRYANIICTSVLTATTAASLVILPRPDTSEIEQRKLAGMPDFSAETFLNGEYTNGITEYYGDTVPFRDDLKKIGSKIRSFFGVSIDNTEIIGNVTVITEQASEKTEPVITSQTLSAPAETGTSVTAADNTVPAETDITDITEATAPVTQPAQTEPPETSAETVSTRKNMNEIAPGVVTNGQVVTKLSDGHWWAISLFGGGRGEVYADALNRFSDSLGDSVKIYSMVVPTCGEYYLPDNYSDVSASHQKSIDAIDSQLNDSIVSVPASQMLWKHTDEPIYLRTDHHWQALGAYYAAQTLSECADVPFADISGMEKTDIPGYVGTMYAFTEKPQLLDDPETFTYYKPVNDYDAYYYDTEYNYVMNYSLFVPMPVNSSYSMFLGGDNKIVRIETDVKNGRRLMVFKDSYGNALIPFLVGSFEEIFVCDIRYFEFEPISFVQENDITDLLFAMCTFSAAGVSADNMTRNFDNTLVYQREAAE